MEHTQSDTDNDNEDKSLLALEQKEENDDQSSLTQENLFMHTHHHRTYSGHRRKASKMSSVGSWTGGSVDWGGGPFIVKRTSIGSGSGMPANLNFYHAANQSSHLWEMDLPDFYDDIPDSLQRIHNTLDRNRDSVPIQSLSPLEDEDDIENEEEIVAELKKNRSASSRKSVRFSAHVVYQSDDTQKLDEFKIMTVAMNADDNNQNDDDDVDDDKNDDEDDNEQNDVDIKEEEQDVVVPVITTNIMDKKEEKEIEFIDIKEESILKLKDENEEKLNVNINKWQIKQVGVDSKYVDIDKYGDDVSDDNKFNENENDSTTDSVHNIYDHDNNINDNMNEEKESDSSLSERSNNGIYDDEVVESDKLRMELTWKTSYFGIFLIGMVWCSSFHCLYSFSSIVNNVVVALNVKLFEFGLMYSFNFIGVGIGLFISSYLLNKPKWINSSQKVSTYGIFIVFISQLIATIIFLYEYAIDSDESPNAILWIILVLSRFIMGIAIGFVESAVNNLVFEWFSDDAFNHKLSHDADQNEKEYLTKLSSRVLSYSLFLKEFGHISARLFLVPLIYLTFSDNTNLFVPLLLGVILSGLRYK